MPNQKPIYLSGGTTTQLSDGDGIIAVAIDTASAGQLSIGAAIANAITIGKDGVTTTFPGDVDIQGNVNTVGGTTFTDDVTFQGNTTFGSDPADGDTVSFANVSIIGPFAFGGGSPTYKITNLADPTAASQDAATAKWVEDQIAAITPVAPGSPVNSIQFNNAGAFDGSSSLQWNGAGGANALAAPIVSLAEGLVPDPTAGYGKLWADTAAKTLHFYDNSIDYLVTPNTVATLVVTPAVLPSVFDTTTLDFAPSLPPLKTVTLATTGGRTGNLEFATTSLLASRNISIRVVGDTVSRNLLFPAGWTWLGGAVPTVLEANKTAILSLAAFSGANTGVIASWSYNGSDVVTDVTASLPLASSGGPTPNLSITAGTASGELLTWNGLAWVASAPATNGTVTSVNGSGGTTGMTLSGGPFSTTGTLTLGGTLDVDNGGTGATTLTGYVKGSGTSALTASASIPGADISGDISGNAANVTGTVAVDHGGTGATTLTGYLSGNGTGAFTASASIPGADISGDISGNAANVTGTVAIANGGTGETTASAAFGALSPLTTKGDVLGFDTLNARVPVGANGQVLTADSAEALGLKWATPATGSVTSVTATAPLSSTEGTAPDISLTGIIDVANGGTGVATITAGSLVIGDDANAINEIAPVIEGQVLTVVSGAWASASIPAATDYSVAAIITAAAVKTAVTVAGAAALATTAAAGTARVAGIVKATDSVQVLGIVTCLVQSNRAGQISAGEPVYLSASEAGKVTDVAPSASTQVVAELGIATAADLSGNVTVLWQPKSIVVL